VEKPTWGNAPNKPIQALINGSSVAHNGMHMLSLLSLQSCCIYHYGKTFQLR